MFMMPTDNETFQIIMQALSNCIESADPDSFPNSKSYNAVYQELLDGILVVMDTQPICSVEDCEASAQFRPFVLLIPKGQGQPAAQMEPQPPFVCCADHMPRNPMEIVTEEGWRQMQSQCAEQGMFVMSNDLKLVAQNLTSGQLIDPSVIKPAIFDGKAT